MSKFLRLTNLLLNTNDIHKIVITPGKYCFYVVCKQIDGFSWGIAGFGTGNISSYTYEFEVCKLKDSNDYKMVTDWIYKQ
jgi:hypothetical protein